MNKSNRRDFLKHSALLGTAAILPSGLLAKGQSKQNEPVSGSSSNDTYTVNMRQILATHLPPRQIIIPDVAGYKALKGDFHIHT
ncbi:MAG: twin-arginine translocation signal domain-containing protein, partial [Tannerella sp.]|nr:twin-arginine translocation signal domain-containing protein [Tannerella sp.]